MGVDDEIIQYNNVLRTDPLCVYRRGEGGLKASAIPIPTVLNTSCILDFCVFDNFDLLTQAPEVCG